MERAVKRVPIHDCLLRLETDIRCIRNIVRRTIRGIAEITRAYAQVHGTGHRSRNSCAESQRAPKCSDSETVQKPSALCARSSSLDSTTSALRSHTLHSTVPRRDWPIRKIQLLCASNRRAKGNTCKNKCEPEESCHIQPRKLDHTTQEKEAAVAIAYERRF